MSKEDKLKKIDEIYKIENKKLEKIAAFFYYSESTVKSLINSNAYGSSIMLSNEFRFDLKKNLASLKIWNNSKLIMNKAIPFSVFSFP